MTDREVSGSNPDMSVPPSAGEESGVMFMRGSVSAAARVGADWLAGRTRKPPPTLNTTSVGYVAPLLV